MSAEEGDCQKQWPPGREQFGNSDLGHQLLSKLDYTNILRHYSNLAGCCIIKMRGYEDSKDASNILWKREACLSSVPSFPFFFKHFTTAHILLKLRKIHLHNHNSFSICSSLLYPALHHVPKHILTLPHSCILKVFLVLLTVAGPRRKNPKPNSTTTNLVCTNLLKSCYSGIWPFRISRNTSHFFLINIKSLLWGGKCCQS